MVVRETPSVYHTRIVNIRCQKDIKIEDILFDNANQIWVVKKIERKYVSISDVRNFLTGRCTALTLYGDSD